MHQTWWFHQHIDVLSDSLLGSCGMLAANSCNHERGFIWIDYNDLTATLLEWWSYFGELSKNGQWMPMVVFHSLVRYYDLLLTTNHKQPPIPPKPYDANHPHKTCMMLFSTLPNQNGGLKPPKDRWKWNMTPWKMILILSYFIHQPDSNSALHLSVHV